MCNVHFWCIIDLWLHTIHTVFPTKVVSYTVEISWASVLVMHSRMYRHGNTHKSADHCNYMYVYALFSYWKFCFSLILASWSGNVTTLQLWVQLSICLCAFLDQVPQVTSIQSGLYSHIWNNSLLDWDMFLSEIHPNVAMFWEPCNLRYGDISKILCPFSVFSVVMWVIFKTKQLCW